MKKRYKLNRRQFRRFLSFCLSCALTLTVLVAGARDLNRKVQISREKKAEIESSLPKLSADEEDLLAMYITCTKSSTSEAEEIVREVFSGVSMKDAISKRSEIYGNPDYLGYFAVSVAEKTVREELRKELSGK